MSSKKYPVLYRSLCPLVAIVLVSLSSFCGCATSEKQLWDRMLESCPQKDASFPDGKNQQLIQFAHLGQVETKVGNLQIVYVRSILTGMLSPRGQKWMAVFNESGDFIGRINCDANPMSCYGSHVILDGYDTHGDPYGNAWDFYEGFDFAKLIRVERVELPKSKSLWAGYNIEESSKKGDGGIKN